MGGRRDPKSWLLLHWPFALVLLVDVVGFIRIAMQHWRQGSLLIGGSLLLAAVLRGVLSSQQAGLLAIRSRVIDVLLYGGLGLLLVAVAATIKP